MEKIETLGVVYYHKTLTGQASTYMTGQVKHPVKSPLGGGARVPPSCF